MNPVRNLTVINRTLSMADFKINALFNFGARNF